MAKPAGVFRVFVLGGSALYGIGVQSGTTYPLHPTLANDETITFFLERELNARVRAAGLDVQVEVVNAGVTAYQTFHPRSVLLRDALRVPAGPAAVSRRP